MSGSGEMPDLSALLSQLGQAQQNLRAAQEAATARVVEGAAGGGLVRIVGTGGLDVEAVTIDASVVNADDVGTLQDLVLAAVRGYVDAARQLQAEALGGLQLGGGLEGLLGG